MLLAKMTENNFKFCDTSKKFISTGKFILQVFLLFIGLKPGGFIEVEISIDLTAILISKADKNDLSQTRKNRSTVSEFPAF